MNDNDVLTNKGEAMLVTKVPDTLPEAALHYGKLGYKVFPCKPKGKSPMTSHGCKDATTDLSKIKEWWSKIPNANIGIATEGLVVIDVDPVKEGGQ